MSNAGKSFKTDCDNYECEGEKDFPNFQVNGFFGGEIGRFLPENYISEPADPFFYLIFFIYIIVKFK